MLLDGVRDEQSLTTGLDSADCVVVRLLLVLISESAAPSGKLTKQEKKQLISEFGTSEERRLLQDSLATATADLEKKGEGLQLLQQAVKQQREEKKDELRMARSQAID